eukprot:gnl/TRDRNA2_/TRDRNA2_202499_c0_seq1.p1 gnl/TRDRNA2_/TRDRNA2_202499_c0~~gnl/TRDRNA2_/TRDRNA2_202499_c0_seq1.p1  ORF type:complete len:211 (-),score=35.51 gnl/TRDRNA2_/TRDRNA2_202499_c0_seq1:54-653(-)
MSADVRLAASSSTASAAKFQFPPFYGLPPFFTLQPHAAVRAKQLALWKQLVCDYCAFHRIFILEVSDAGRHELFRNTALQRQLTTEGLRAVAAHLVSEGAAAWAEGTSAAESRQRLIIWWRSPGEWADMLLRWAEDSGMIGEVETVHSLCEGELSEGQAFHGAPCEVILVALQELVYRGRAAIFTGSVTNQEGVKFLPP